MGIFNDTGIYKGPGIYKTGADNGGGGGGGGGLPIPAGYEQLDSCISWNKGRISNFVIDTSNWSGVTVEVNFKYLEVFESKYSFSINSTNSFYCSKVYNVLKLSYNHTPIGGYPGDINLDQLAADGTLIKAIFDGPNGKLFWNDEAHIIGFPQITTNFSVGGNVYGNGSQKMELFSLIIRDSSNTIVFYGTPVKRTLDEVEGILDILTGTFYTA